MSPALTFSALRRRRTDKVSAKERAHIIQFFVQQNKNEHNTTKTQKNKKNRS